MKFFWTKYFDWFANSSFSLSEDNAVKVLKLEAFSFGNRLEYLMQTSMHFIHGRMNSLQEDLRSVWKNEIKKTTQI